MTQTVKVAGQDFTFLGGNKWQDASGQVHTVSKSDAMGYGMSMADASQYYGADTYQAGQSAGTGADANLWNQRFRAVEAETGMQMPDLTDPANKWLLKFDNPLEAWDKYKLGAHNNTAVNPNTKASYLQNRSRMTGFSDELAGTGARTPEEQASYDAELAYYSGVRPDGQRVENWANPNQSGGLLARAEAGRTTLTEDVPAGDVLTTQAGLLAGADREWSQAFLDTLSPVRAPIYDGQGDSRDLTAELQARNQGQKDIGADLAYYNETIKPQAMQDPKLAALDAAGIDWTKPATRGAELAKVEQAIKENPELAATLQSQFENIEAATGNELKVKDTDLKTRFIPFLIAHGITDLTDVQVQEDGTMMNRKTGLPVPSEIGYDATVAGGVRGTYKLTPVTFEDGTYVVPDMALNAKKTGIQQAMPVAVAALSIFGGPITGTIGKALAPGLGVAAQTAIGTAVMSTGMGALGGLRGADLLKAGVAGAVGGYAANVVGSALKGSELANVASKVTGSATRDLISGQNPLSRYSSPMGIASLFMGGNKAEGEV